MRGQYPKFLQREERKPLQTHSLISQLHFTEPVSATGDQSTSSTGPDPGLSWGWKHWDTVQIMSAPLQLSTKRCIGKMLQASPICALNVTCLGLLNHPCQIAGLSLSATLSAAIAMAKSFSPTLGLLSIHDPASQLLSRTEDKTRAMPAKHTSGNTVSRLPGNSGHFSC